MDVSPCCPTLAARAENMDSKPWEYPYDSETDQIVCPRGNMLRHTTTDRSGKRTYRSKCSDCKTCPCREKYGANEKGQNILQRHIWQEFLDLAQAVRKTEFGKQTYARRKETIERVFADAKEKHAMRYTHHRGLARVTQWVRLKYVAMNLKKLANWLSDSPFPSQFLSFFDRFFLPLLSVS